MDRPSLDASTIVWTKEAPSLCLEEDGSWSLLFGDAGVAVIMEAAAVRTMNADYLAQMMGGPVRGRPRAA